MAGRTKSATTRKSRGKSKNDSGAEQLLQDLTGKIGALASDAATALKDAGITTKKTAGRALEGTKKKAGEAASHLPVVGDGDKPKSTRKRSTSSSATGKKSSASSAKASTAKSSTAAKSNGKKSTPASTRASSAKSSAAKSGSKKSSAKSS